MTLYPVPKPAPRVKKPRARVKPVNAKRHGHRFPKRRDPDFLAWIHGFPCAICVAMGYQQISPTEAEHFVERSRGGYDKGDVFPTCAEHRELRHVQWGPRKFARVMLNQFGLDLRKLCRWFAELYDAKRCI